MASTNGKARADIYRKAAQRVEKHGDIDFHAPGACTYGYACNAIEDVQRRSFLGKKSAARIAFEQTFTPGWANEQGFFGEMESMKNRNYRVVALCFMAAMVEAGDA